ncbi:hypothetical protein LPJ53_003056 [Coemansia erecta]|uniref:WLM domain-containing protein n=1 Tax=Coemansia erecta TaxID=147472 RepID=A0A9W7Y1Z5_9FUNG|nr:hypothetical protein LPJ53_003056 [Coemansia erecta]
MAELIGSMHVLERQRNSAEALALLQRVAAQVQPVMRSRGWRVGVLREFLPRNAQLLGVNVNGGQEIRLRLRPAHDASAGFLAFGDLVGTMLHELAHIVRGPHDGVFYATLDQLRDETQRLMDTGYAGDGFFSAGRRVGLGVSHNAATMAEARARAVGAAERRAGARSLGGPPRTLAPADGAGAGAGAAAAWRALQAAYSPAQLAARAAERRLRDEAWCGETMRGAAAEAGGLIVISDSESDRAPSVVVLSDSDAGSESDGGS